jgi:hypothetical protein
MKRTTLGSALIASAVSTVLTGALTGCGYTQPPPFEPRQIERIQRSEAEQTETRPLRSLPTTLESPTDVGGPCRACRRAGLIARSHWSDQRGR